LAVVAPNRSVIRDTGLISDLVGIISTPDVRDLHMQAVLVLSWLFEDFETLQVNLVIYGLDSRHGI
jgi:hypothetical protein